MAWTVILEDENKTKLKSLSREFTSDNLIDVSINREFKLLQYIDPYGDTIFNRLQIDDLISDLKGLREIAYDETIDEAIELALACKSKQHTYLIFYGD